MTLTNSGVHWATHCHSMDESALPSPVLEIEIEVEVESP